MCESLKNAISILTMLCFGILSPSLKRAATAFPSTIFYGISRESLPERPQEINDRQTFGHLKGYCVYGKKRTKVYS